MQQDSTVKMPACPSQDFYTDSPPGGATPNQE